MSNYHRNLQTLARCQARWDRMEPPEYYDDMFDGEEVIDPEEDDHERED